MRKLASIVEIESCDPIPDTERLAVTKMKGLGWQIVTQRDEFKPGDAAVFFEIDSLLPADDSRYEFLKDRCLRKFMSKSGNLLDQGIRIKTIKLRGVYSQGLVLPIEQFPELLDRITLAEKCEDDRIRVQVVKDDGSIDTDIVPLWGADVTAILGVRHFDDVKAALEPVDNHAIGGDAYSLFPVSFVPKTDETRLQVALGLFESCKNRRFEASIKADGSSCTMVYSPTIDAEHPFMVCSRNIRLKPESRDGTVPVMWQLAKKYDVEQTLKWFYEATGAEWALQGEAVGPGIQSCRNRETEHQWKVFRIWDITNQKFVDPATRRKFCADHGIPHVEILAEEMPVFQEFQTLEGILKFAEGKTAAGNEREGVVFKTVDEPYVSFKAISNRYLLKAD